MGVIGMCVMVGEGVGEMCGSDEDVDVVREV